MGATALALPIRRGNRLYVDLASGPADVRAAQALRYRVFGEEMGAQLKGGEANLDVDEFDPYCQRLLVRESDSGRVVGCTRLLTNENASRIGRFYSESEFEIRAIRGLPGRILEVGRTCIAPEYRQGSGIAVLWSGLAGFIHLHGIDYLFGCASMPLGEKDMQAAAIMNRVRRQAMAAGGIQVTPRVPLYSARSRMRFSTRPCHPFSRPTSGSAQKRVVRPAETPISGSPTCSCCSMSTSSIPRIHGTSWSVPRPLETMPNFVAVWRLLRVAEHLLTGAVIALVIAAGQRFGVRWERIPDLVSWWHKRLCRALGMRVQVTGAPAPSALMVANHVSWLDIPVIGAQGRIGFLSKSEVGRWPLIGWMATIAGTLFLTRGAIQAGEVICRIEERLRAGGGLVVFPEGTTTDGTRLQRFHPRLLAAGQRGGVQVQPVALRFGENAAPDRVAPFLGDDALLALRAFKHIAEGTPHARFVLVGDGPERERLRHDHPELILPGVKVGMELAEHYASGDLFLFPSLTETFGNVVLEAMASGLPVIAFDYAAAAACIRNRDNGFRVPMGDADAFVDAAVAAVGDSSRLGFMSEAARTAAESMSWGQVVQDLERRFFDVIRLRRERPNETLAATLE